ncbi:MAG: chemotaxis protein CheW [Myxococcales bacterium]|nr:chemotaxis protein CheW [Myxococcales bacterium]
MSASTQQQMATFFVDGELFGVDVKDVQEVLMAQEVTPVPLAPPHIVGLTNLRGQILPALDLRTRLGIAPRPEKAPSSNLVVKTSEGPVSLVVDEIGDVIELPTNAWREVPETVSPAERQFVQQIATLEDRLMLRLDIGRLLDEDGKHGGEDGARGGDR